MAQEVVIDIDFSGLENLRRLHETLGTEASLRSYLEQQRFDRILSLSKPKRKPSFPIPPLGAKLEDCLTRMAGFFVIQIQLIYNLP